ATLMPRGDVAAQSQLIVTFKQDHFTAGLGNISIGSEAADHVMRIRPGRDVAHEYVWHLWEPWRERDANEPAFPRGIDRQRDEWFRLHLTVANDAEPAGLLADKDVAIRCNVERCCTG